MQEAMAGKTEDSVIIKKRRMENEVPLTFVLIEKINVRHYADKSEYGMCSAVTSRHDFNAIERVVLTDTKLKVNKAYIADRNSYSIMKESNMIKIMPKSILFETKMPNVSRSLIEGHINPPELSVKESLSMLSGQRVSITGYITKVSNILHSPSSKRKIVVINDQITGESMEVKLWGDKSAISVDSSTQLMFINCLEINEYNNKKSANSTVNTYIKTIEKEQEVEGEIEGAHIDITDSQILVNGNTYKLPYDLLHKIFPDNTFIPGKVIKATCKGNTIISVLTMEEDD